MITRKFITFTMLAALLPVLVIALPAGKAEARNGRNAAFIAGLVIGATGAAAIYHHNKTRKATTLKHYHKGYATGCHTHNGVYHCHRKTYYQKRPVKRTRAWYSYCASKYRSFNPNTGLYITFKGYKRQCR